MKAKDLKRGDIFFYKGILERKGRIFVKSRLTNPEFSSKILANKISIESNKIFVTPIETLIGKNEKVVLLDI